MIKIKEITPMFTALVTTMDVYETDNMNNDGIILTNKMKGTIKEYQKVVSVGTTVRDIKVGDIVCINPTRFAKLKHKEGSLKDGVIMDNPVTEYNFPIIELNDKPHLLLQVNDIDFIIKDYEEIPEPKATDLYIPPKKELIA